jgi:hypothetical protein
MTAPGADAAIFARIRAAVLCIWIVVVLLTPYGSYAHLPAELGTGLGIGRVLLDVEWLRHLLWSERALTVLQWLAICGAVAQLAAGRRLRWLMPVVFVTILALDALTKSLTGYVNHAQIAPLVVLLLVTVFGHAPAGAREAVWLIRLTLVLPYTFIGLHRLIEGGVEIFLGDALLQYIAQNTAGYSFYGLAWGRGLIALPLAAALLKAGFAAMTLFELLSPAALVWPRFRRIWVAVMAVFHVAILATMNIFFWENLVLLLVAFGRRDEAVRQEQSSASDAAADGARASMRPHTAPGIS